MRKARAVAAAVPLALALAVAPLATASTKHPDQLSGLTATVFTDGHVLGLSQPDDISAWNGDLYVGYQNGIGPTGAAASNGAVDSAVVEYRLSTGQALHEWWIPGHMDGLTVDPYLGRVLATVNEDANSSLWGIRPNAAADAQLTQYTYQTFPLPHGGGTDAISIVGHKILISASAPSPAPRDVPAVYVATLKDNTATLKPLFMDKSTAMVANLGPTQGSTVSLALTDPDSNEVVPGVSPRFSGDFVLDSQGDEEQIYVHDAGEPGQHLYVLKLSQSIDDSAWATSTNGTLYVADNDTSQVFAVTGDFAVGTTFVAVTPGDANNAPSDAPPDSLGILDLETGVISAVPGITIEPHGLAFVR